MAYLTTLSDLSRERNYDFRREGVDDPTGQSAYVDGQRLGTVRDALVDTDDARLRYLIVDLNEDDGGRGVIVPIGYARLEHDGIHLDGLSREQISTLHHYRSDEVYSYDAQVSDERTLRGADYSELIGYREDLGLSGGAERAYNYRDEDASDTMFKTPGRLQLLEERLRVDKERYVAGSVEIGKHVETREQQVTVPVSRKQLVLRRRMVNAAQPVGGGLQVGANLERIRLVVEAERARVHKATYAAEEVSVEKRQVSETQTVTGTVGREVLDVQLHGEAYIASETTGEVGQDDGTRR